MKPLFDAILNYIPAPEGDPDADTQVLISTIDYNEYVGRIGIGKVDNGTIRVNQDAVIVNHHDPDKMKKLKFPNCMNLRDSTVWKSKKQRLAQL